MEQVGRNAHFRVLLITGLLLALAIPACANAGTLLMLAGVGHLLIGNAIIGLFEAFVIAHLYDIRYYLISPLAVLANYLSMVAGVALMMQDNVYKPLTNVLLGNTPLYRLPWLLGGMTAITFVLSVLIEWPLYHAAFHRNRQRDIEEYGNADAWEYRRQRILQATVLAQVASYLLLAVCYACVSGTGFIRHARVMHGLGFAANPTAVVYYLHDGENYRVQLDGSSPVAVSAKEVETVFTKYFERYSSGDNSFFRFINSSTGGSAFDLRDHAGVGWQARTHFWGTSGLELQNDRTGESFDLGLELPFVSWPSRHATLLPGDQVVYQFGPQIVLLDINTRQLAFIALGSRPVVVCK